MKKEYMEAFTEVNEIIKLMPIELLNKIPLKFRQMIEEERDKEYITDIKEPIEKCRLKKETIIILGLIYRDFLCSPEEKKRLQEKDAEELKKVQIVFEQKLREKYNPNDIFKNKQTTINNEIEHNPEDKAIMVVQKEKWYQKIFNIIKGLFKNNN